MAGSSYSREGPDSSFENIRRRLNPTRSPSLHRNTVGGNSIKEHLFTKDSKRIPVVTQEEKPNEFRKTWLRKSLPHWYSSSLHL